MTEKELIEKLKKHDREAFNFLIQEYNVKIINICYSLLSDREDAEDASQEVFIKIYRNIDSFKEKSSLSTWIYRITSNVCKDFLRKRVKRPATLSITGQGEDENDTDIEDTGPTPEDNIEKSELEGAVRRAISKLSDDYRTVLVLCDIEGMSYEEISKILKCPEGTVKSRLSRARKSLKKIILENGELF